MERKSKRFEEVYIVVFTIVIGNDFFVVEGSELFDWEEAHFRAYFDTSQNLVSV